MLGPVDQHVRAQGMVLLLRPLGPLPDRHQPIERLIELGRELHEHRRHLVRAPRSVCAGLDRDRNYGYERLVGKFVAVDQEPSKGAGADGQDDVVHRGPGGVLQALDIGEADG